MSNRPKAEYNGPENQYFNAALDQMSEAELTSFLKHVKALNTDLGAIIIPDSEPVEAITEVQNYLKIWIEKISRLMSLKQVKDLNKETHTWDNEGGTVHRSASRRLLSQIVNGERRLVWIED